MDAFFLYRGDKMAILKIKDAEGNIKEILAIKGENGKDYVLTEADKKEIADIVKAEILSGDEVSY